MRVVLQRVTRGRVSVGHEEIAGIGPGLVALVGVAGGDGPEDATRLAAKTVRLRLFPQVQFQPSPRRARHPVVPFWHHAVPFWHHNETLLIAPFDALHPITHLAPISLHPPP